MSGREEAATRVMDDVKQSIYNGLHRQERSNFSHDIEVYSIVFSTQAIPRILIICYSSKVKKIIGQKAIIEAIFIYY